MVDKICVFPKSTEIPVNNPQNCSTNVYWGTLCPAIEVPDPLLETECDFHGPKEDPLTRSQQPRKQNFDNIYDHPYFLGHRKVPLFTRLKQQKLDNNKHPLSGNTTAKKERLIKTLLKNTT